jgi:hypothetical protein
MCEFGQRDLFGFLGKLYIRITWLLRSQSLSHKFMHGCSNIHWWRRTPDIIHFDNFSQIFNDFMTLIDPSTPCTQWFLRESCVCSVYLRLETVHTVREGLVFQAELGNQCINVFFILRAQVAVSTTYSTAGLCPGMKHLSAIEGHLFLVRNSGHLMQKDLVSETVSLAQRLHKHLSIRIVDLVVDCATSTSLLLRIVVVLYET